MAVNRVHVAPPNRPGKRPHDTSLAHAGKCSLRQGQQTGSRLLLAPTYRPEEANPLTEQNVDVVRRENGRYVVQRPLGIADMLGPCSDGASEAAQPSQQQRAAGVHRHDDAA